MSGGQFNYAQRRLASELFEDLWLEYGEDGRNQSKIARLKNPMYDEDVSELVWDTLCLIHSLDWAESSDTSMEDYESDLYIFKKKWVNKDE